MRRGNHIVLMPPDYPPELFSSARFIQDLAWGLRDRGWRVSVVTNYPHSNLTEEDREKYADTARFADVEEDGIRVIRVKGAPLHKVNNLRRGYAYLALPAWQAYEALTRLGKIDHVMAVPPPITMGLAEMAIQRRHGASVSIYLQDLYPEVLKDLGVVKEGWIYDALDAAVNFVYRHCDRIMVHSEGNAEIIRRKVPVPQHVRVAHIWEDLGKMTPERTVNPGMRAKLGVRPDQVAFFYGGVMGPNQGLKIIAEAARRLKDRTDMAFLLFGDGLEYKIIAEAAADLPAVKLHPFISQAQYDGLVVHEMDVGITTLTNRITTPVVPGKVISYMAAGKPFIGALNPQTDVRGIVREAECGMVVDYGDVDALCAALVRLAEDKALRARMGAAGRAYAGTHFERESCIDRFDAMFRELS